MFPVFKWSAFRSPLYIDFGYLVTAIKLEVAVEKSMGMLDNLWCWEDSEYQLGCSWIIRPGSKKEFILGCELMTRRQYSGDLNSRRLRISNGKLEAGLQMEWFQMGSETRRPKHLKSRQKSRFCMFQDFEWSNLNLHCIREFALQM